MKYSILSHIFFDNKKFASVEESEESVPIKGLTTPECDELIKGLFNCKKVQDATGSHDEALALHNIMQLTSNCLVLADVSLPDIYACFEIKIESDNGQIIDFKMLVGRSESTF